MQYSFTAEILGRVAEDMSRVHFMRTLPFMREKLTEYVVQRPEHTQGLCNWLTCQHRLAAMDSTDFAFENFDYYDVIKVLRHQPALIEQFGEEAYVDENGGPTEIRLNFAEALLVLIAQRMAL